MRWLMTRGQLVRHLDTQRVVAALEAAEARTSGEIRVSVAPLFWGDVMKEAQRAFDRLGMRNTRERNGVLIFVVPSRRRFAVLGDEGIHEAVGQAFWQRVSQVLSEHFHRGAFSEGLLAGIAEVGAQLAQHFPSRGAADVNELPNAVDFGGGSGGSKNG
jgi:uncharacterized membrane protein